MPIDPKDVSESRTGLSSGGRAGNLARSSRASGTTSVQRELRHSPTGVTVRGHVAAGHFSRGEMRRNVDELRDRLLIELDAAVTKRIRDWRRGLVRRQLRSCVAGLTGSRRPAFPQNRQRPALLTSADRKIVARLCRQLAPLYLDGSWRSGTSGSSQSVS